MSDFASAAARGDDIEELLDACARGLAGVEGHRLGFVYVTDPLARSFDDIVGGLRERTGIADWVGTVGLGICTTGREYFAGAAIAVLTCRLSDGAFRLLPPVSDMAGLGKHLDPAFMAGIGVVHGDPRKPATLDLIGGLAHDYATFLVGGLTSAETHFPQAAGTVGDGGLSGVLIGGRVQVAVGLSQGCAPIGPSHVVTRGQDNLLITLDDQPAYELLCEDLGVADGVDPRPWLTNVHAAVLVSGADTNDYLVRNLVGLDPGQGLVAIGEAVEPGSRVMFVRRDAENAGKDLARMLADLKSRAAAPKAGLYFSCLARGPNLFDEPAHEMKAIQETFGDIPIAGFFGNGEISNDRVYGYTGVLLLFL